MERTLRFLHRRQCATQSVSGLNGSRELRGMKRERKRGRQTAYVAEFNDTPTELVTSKTPPSSQFRKVITLWIPRRFVSASGIDTVAFVADVNDKIRGRGFVMSDG